MSNYVGETVSFTTKYDISCKIFVSTLYQIEEVLLIPAFIVNGC